MSGTPLLIVQSLTIGVMVGAMLGLVASGLTLIFGVSKIVNFAHGHFLMIGMYITFALFTAFKFDPYLSVFVTTPILFLLGVLLFQLVRPVLGKSEFTTVIITFAVALIASNSALIIFGPAYNVAFVPYMARFFTVSNVIIPLPRLVSIGVAFAVMAVLYWMLSRTDLGRAIRATAENYEAASLLGINYKRMYMITLGIGCACLGIAAPFLLPMFYVYPDVGMNFTLMSFLIVVMGGMGNIAGAMLGGLLIGIIQTVGGVMITGSQAYLAIFAIFVLVLLFRPQGILKASR